MKYRDNKFLKYQDKQRDGEFDYFSNKTERQIRRERNHGFSQFYMRVLSKRIDKIWWNNLSDIDKDSIITSYRGNEIYMNSVDEDSTWYNYQIFDTWDEWFDHIKSEYKPNIVNYREDKLKALGI